MKQKPFEEILYHKIYDQVLKDLHRFDQEEKTTNFHEDLTPSCLSQLLGSIGKMNIKHNFKSQVYYRRPFSLTEPQKKAVQTFKKMGQNIGEAFTIKELKSAFRFLALQIHPDHGGTSEKFIEIQAAFKELLLLFKKV